MRLGRITDDRGVSVPLCRAKDAAAADIRRALAEAHGDTWSGSVFLVFGALIAVAAVWQTPRPPLAPGATRWDPVPLLVAAQVAATAAWLVSFLVLLRRRTHAARHLCLSRSV